MQIAIVGAGGIFESHAKAYRELGAQLSAVVDIDRARAEQAASKYQIPFVSTDWHDLLERDDVDEIDVCTPPKFHRPVVVAALRAGKHVVCEKPLAANLKDCDEIVRAAEESSGKLTVVHQRRFLPGYQRLKRLLERNHLGRICFIRQIHFSPPVRYLVEKGLWGEWDVAGGGVVMTKAVHQLDLLLWLFGDVRRVQAMMGTYLFPIQSEDHAVVNLEFNSGAIASLCVSGYPYGHRDELEVIGDKGTAVFPWEVRLKDSAAEALARTELDAVFPAPSRWSRRVKEVAVRLRLAKWQPEGDVGHRPFLAAFLQAVKGEAHLPVTVQEARKAVELCTAIYTAALTKETVELPLDSSSRFYEGVCKDDYASANRADFKEIAR